MSGFVPIRAGDLNRVITFQQRNTDKDSFGQQSTTWTDYLTARAEIEQLSGSELVSAQALMAETTHRITVRYRPSITASLRVIYQGRVFNVLSVIDEFTADRKSVV